MAMQSNPRTDWVHIESIRDPSSFDIKMRVAILANDGWVKVLNIANDGWVSDDLPTRRQILENIQENITIELAKLTLEET
jgi:hypothetical protein